MLEFFVRLKVIIDRQRSYIVYINFSMIVYLFLEKIGYSLWYLLSIPFFILWTYVDMRYIWPRELLRISKKNPLTQKMLDKWDISVD